MLPPPTPCPRTPPPQALYTQSRAQFDAFVGAGTLLNNYAHIFDLLIRLRQVWGGVGGAGWGWGVLGTWESREGAGAAWLPARPNPTRSKPVGFLAADPVLVPTPPQSPPGRVPPLPGRALGDGRQLRRRRRRGGGRRRAPERCARCGRPDARPRLHASRAARDPPSTSSGHTRTLYLSHPPQPPRASTTARARCATTPGRTRSPPPAATASAGPASSSLWRPSAAT
jgi:hypothetical protein